MKKTLLTILSLFLFVPFLFAQILSIKTWGGYATVSMRNINNQLGLAYTLIKQSAEAEGVEPIENKYTKVESGIIWGIEALYNITADLGMGIRAGYLLPSEGTFIGNYKVNQPGIMKTEYTLEAKVSGFFIPVMAGGMYKIKFDKIDISCGLFSGYGMAYATQTYLEETIIDYDPAMEALGNNDVSDKTEYEVPVSGSCISFNVIAGINFNFTQNIAAGLEAGYLIANITEIKADKDIDEAGIKKGDVIKKTDAFGKESNLETDFSGINLCA